MFPSGYYFYYPHAVTLLLILFIVMQPVALLSLDPPKCVVEGPTLAKVG